MAGVAQASPIVWWGVQSTPNTIILQVNSCYQSTKLTALQRNSVHLHMHVNVLKVDNNHTLKASNFKICLGHTCTPRPSYIGACDYRISVMMSTPNNFYPHSPCLCHMLLLSRCLLHVLILSPLLISFWFSSQTSFLCIPWKWPHFPFTSDSNFLLPCKKKTYMCITSVSYIASWNQ